jgi:hypothetical protein
MSREVLAALTPVYELATYSPPEIRGLFTDWMGEIEREIAAFVKSRGVADPDEIAAKFRLQRESVVSILGRLAAKSGTCPPPPGDLPGSL